MAIHASERWANTEARLQAWYSGLTITGTPDKTYDRVDRDQDAPNVAFIRMSLEPLPANFSGFINSTETAVEELVLVVFDLFWPSVDTDTRAIWKAADDLGFEMRGLSLQMLDYSSTPATPTTITGYFLRAIRPVERISLPVQDGYDRLRVSVTVRWFSSHT